MNKKKINVWYVTGKHPYVPTPPGWNIGDQAEFTFRIVREPIPSKNKYYYQVWLGYDQNSTISDYFIEDFHQRLERAIKFIKHLKEKSG